MIPRGLSSDQQGGCPGGASHPAARCSRLSASLRPVNLHGFPRRMKSSEYRLGLGSVPSLTVDTKARAGDLLRVNRAGEARVFFAANQLLSRMDSLELLDSESLRHVAASLLKIGTERDANGYQNKCFALRDELWVAT